MILVAHLEHYIPEDEMGQTQIEEMHDICRKVKHRYPHESENPLKVLESPVRGPPRFDVGPDVPRL